MRTVCWMAVVAMAMLAARPAQAQHWLWGEQDLGSLQAAPGCGPTCGALQPGCCENPPRCGDNAWRGYCQERAQWLAWAQQCHERCEARFGSSCQSCGEVIVCRDEVAGGESEQADVYYAGASRRSSPSPASHDVVRAPPTPLTPAIGRRIGYPRPPIRPQH